MSRFMGWWRSFFLAATDAPAVYGEGAGLMVLSTLALGHRWVDVGEGINPNLNMLLTGDSSIARKSTSVKFAQKAVEEIDPGRIGPADYTMEGLFKWMQIKDERTGKGRTRFTLFSTEFGTDLARSEAYGGTWREDLCRLYDGDDVTKVRAKSDSVTILKPRVNLFGGVAYRLLSEYCSRKDWFIGFFMRFLFVSPTVMREASSMAPPFPRAAWNMALGQLHQLHDEWSKSGIGLPLSQQATDYYSKFMASIPIDKDDDVAHIYAARLGPNILKLALLYQLDIDPHAEISVVAMDHACRFVQYTLWGTFKKVYRITTQREFDTALMAVHELASRNQGVSRQEIYETFKAERGLPDSIVSYLKKSGIYERGLDEAANECWRVRK